MSVLEEFLKLDLAGPELTIGVIGDAMVDEYINVRVKKISPEFPIPVMQTDDEELESFPGGAANVAYQFKHFNINAPLLAFTDSAANLCFAKHNIDTNFCVNIPTKIPRKRRFYSGDFPTYRWDIEKEGYGLENLDKKCLELYGKSHEHAQTFNALIFSDYGKGVFNKYNDLLIPEIPISVVDPKSGDLDRWRGCTVFKPNYQEALNLSGQNTLYDAGNYLLDKLKCEAVIITQGGTGITIFDHYSPAFGGGIYEVRPTTKLPPAESVIGAGDCFTAFLTMALARGMGIKKSAEVAWEAGTLYVRNRYNKPIPKLCLIDKIIPESPEEYIGPKGRDYKLVFTNGVFDILHQGHLQTLKFAKSQGDKLVVAVNSDESTARLKPGRPIISLEQRMALLAGLECVDFVVSFDQDTPLELIKKIQPDTLVKGAEYQVEKIAGSGFVKEVVTAPMVEGLSTTKIIGQIQVSHDLRNEACSPKSHS